MKAFFLSGVYLASFCGAIDRIQIGANRGGGRASWVSGVAFLGPNWFYGFACLMFCLLALSALHEFFVSVDRARLARHVLFHAGLALVAYAIWRTGLASLNPWCTGGRLCAAREAQTWPIEGIVATGVALLVASGFIPCRSPAETLPRWRLQGRARIGKRLPKSP